MLALENRSGTEHLITVCVRLGQAKKILRFVCKTYLVSVLMLIIKDSGLRVFSERRPSKQVWEATAWCEGEILERHFCNKKMWLTTS